VIGSPPLSPSPGDVLGKAIALSIDVGVG